MLHRFFEMSGRVNRSGCRGTRVLTVSDEVAIEALQFGDLMVIFAGNGASLKPTRCWAIAGSTDALYRRSDPEDTNLISFRASSLGEGCLHRDGLVSPGHRMCIDDVVLVLIHRPGTIGRPRTSERGRLT